MGGKYLELSWDTNSFKKVLFIVLWIDNGEFSGGSDGKASPYNVGDPGSIPGLEDPPEKEKEMATHSSTLVW